MTAGGTGLPAVGPLTGDDMHLVVSWSTHNVARHFGHCSGYAAPTIRIGGNATFPHTLHTATNLIAAHERSNEAWELQRHVGTIFIGVHVAARRPCLPFVGTMQIHIEFLTSAEGIALGETNLQLRSHTPDGALCEVRFKINVIRTVEDAIHNKVEGIVRQQG